MPYIKYIAKLMVIAFGRTGLVLIVCLLSVIAVMLFFQANGDPRCVEGYVAKEGEMIVCEE